MSLIVITAVLAAVYLGQLIAKSVLAARYRERCLTKVEADSPNHSETLPAVSIFQPILSGDPALEATLQANIETFLGSATHFFWLVDENDPTAASICETLVARFPTQQIKILRSPPPPQGVNPKVFKLVPALEQITTPYLVVLDDDTRLSVAGLRALVDGLASGAALATGLPRYHATGGGWSAWLAEFVNSSAVLTYLPPLAWSEPISIHGMCYAMRTDEARRLNVFRTIEHHLTDDLALALLLQRNQLRIHQTIEPHDLATTLPTLRALLRIMHRWFVFTRLLLDAQGVGMRFGIAMAYGVPPLLLWAVVVLAFLSPWNAALLLGCVAGREVILHGVARKFLGTQTANERSMVASLGQELAQPMFLAAACCSKTILWRSRRIRVRQADSFEYL